MGYLINVLVPVLSSCSMMVLEDSSLYMTRRTGRMTPSKASSSENPLAPTCKDRHWFHHYQRPDSKANNRLNKGFKKKSRPGTIHGGFGKLGKYLTLDWKSCMWKAVSSEKTLRNFPAPTSSWHGLYASRTCELR